MKVRLGFAATLLYILSLAGNMVAQAPQTEQMMDKKRQHIVEIATVSVLAAIGNVEPMMKGHMNIALNVGVTPDELRNLLAIVEKQLAFTSGRPDSDRDCR